MSIATLFNRSLKTWESANKYPVLGALTPDNIIGKAKISFVGGTGLPTATSRGIPGIGATRLGTGLYRLQALKAREFDVWHSVSVPTLGATTATLVSACIVNKSVSSGTIDVGTISNNVRTNPPDGAEVNLFFFVDPLAKF